MTEEEIQAHKKERELAIMEYHDAVTRQEKAKVVAKYPFLKEIYSEVNHTA